MTVTTEEWWGVGEVSLQTLAWNIVTLGGDRLAPPPLRGDPLLVPYRPGRVLGPRIPDARVITLGMWVQGSETDGTPPPPGTSHHKKFMENFRTLRSLLWTPDGEFDLTKRLDTGEVVTAKAMFAGGLAPSMNGNAHGAFTVDLYLADPFFYGSEVSVPVSGTVTIDNPGDWTTFNIELDMSAGGMVVNSTVEPSVWCSVTAASTVKVREFQVDNSGVTSGLLSHGGAKQWFLLYRGENTVTASGGAAVLRYRPAYI